jgi:hypothetical protein
MILMAFVLPLCETIPNVFWKIYGKTSLFQNAGGFWNGLNCSLLSEFSMKAGKTVTFTREFSAFSGCGAYPVALKNLALAAPPPQACSPRCYSAFYSKPSRGGNEAVFANPDPMLRAGPPIGAAANVWREGDSMACG